MGFFNLSEIQSGVAKTKIGKIILGRRIDILLSLDIISRMFV